MRGGSGCVSTAAAAGVAGGLLLFTRSERERHRKMATYLKRTSKLYDLSAISRPVASVALRDLMCPVCRGILVEPVTLPCTHNLCLRCLRGTFEHNSLSCPLCRLRVGSWLRTATKSETLVNNDLWQLIQLQFPKELQQKYTGNQPDSALDDGFETANKILSASGEIRREYEAQLQLAEEELRRQREAEKLASEALIRKIQEEEQQQQLAQLAQDQLLAKSLAKRQALENQKNAANWYNEHQSPPQAAHKPPKPDLGTSVEATVPRTEPPPTSQNVNSAQKMNKSAADKDSGKICCQKPTGQLSSSSPQPGPSSVGKVHPVAKAVPGAEKKGSSENEEDDEDRCGSSESGNSHDSISREMVHFKPIMTVPRTPYRILKDGTEIRPLLITITPTYRRISNARIKPPSHLYAKLILRNQWSAFCGQARQRLELEKMIEKPVEKSSPSTSYDYPEVEMVGPTTSSAVPGPVSSPELAPKVVCDDNKNYTKATGRLINGVKGIKKNVSEDSTDGDEVGKTWKHRGLRCKRDRNAWSSRNDAKCSSETKNSEETETGNSTSSSTSAKTSMEEEGEEQEQEQDEDLAATENIAERIKKRKVNLERKNPYRISNASSEPETVKRSTRKRLCGKEDLDYSPSEDSTVAVQKRVKTKFTRATLPRTKRQRASRRLKGNPESPEKSDSSTDYSYRAISYGLRKSARNLKHAYSSSTSSEQEGQVASKRYNYSSAESCSEILDNGSESNNATAHELEAEKGDCSDEDVIKEQERMERLVLQEKEDFELARRLQAKFNEMEGIAGRTRRSRRRAIENSSLEADLSKGEIGLTVEKPGLYTKR